MSLKKQLIGLLGWVFICFAASATGAVASIRASAVYGDLAQPTWAPPSSVFGPVWTVLYLLMAVAAWLVWREGGFALHRKALSFFLVQLALNALWTWLFFGWFQGALAFADIVLLWALIAFTTALFWRVRPLAGGLLIPYLAWVTFAAALNFAVWRMNPAVLGG